MNYSNGALFNQKHSEALLETRPIQCPSGALRMITVSPWTWDAYELFLQHGWTEREIATACYDYVQANSGQYGFDDNTLFECFFISYVSECFKSYCTVYGSNRELVLGVRPSK